MNYPSIRIEGAILSPDILDRIEDAQGQRPVDFGLESSAKVKDEILRVWADAQHYWNAFQRKLESLKTDSPATTETRNLWVVPLLTLLGYQLEYQARGADVNGKNYPISHRVINRANTAFHIIGYQEPSELDKKPEKMTHRMSAHAMVQEYLNLDDQLYGLVTNGRLLRLLRNSSRLVKLSYLEFDLDRIFADGLFADFAVLFRLLHASRLPQPGAPAASCWLERYHQETIEQGTRIRDGLRDSVTEALEILGTGFLAHPNNAALCQQVKSGELRTDVYFGFLLRLIYRLLFLMVIEERRLVFPAGVDPKKVALYLEHYSVQRLRRLSVTRGLKIERFHDAWLALLSTFQLFESPVRAEKFGTTVLGGQLFNPDSLGPLTKSRLDNAALFGALDRLCYFYHPETKQRMPVNFGALATEEFGSVYESLLELHPVVELEPKPHFGFRQVAGNERKTTGSYYTPTSLVTCLLDSALDPILEERIERFKALGFKTVDEAVLALNVCDPACGSGHFLNAAAQRIARRLARAGDEEPSPALLRHTLREVIGNCIYGVDVNPMSVELCKVALWLEAVEPGKPLNFLDHHIKCGNSLLGAMPDCIRDGIPDKAYEPITGDDKEAARWMRKLNKDAREGQTHFDFSDAKPWDRLGNLPAAIAELETLEDETPAALVKKEKLYRQILEGSGYENARLLYDAWCAAFVLPKQKREYGTELTTEHLRKIERNPHSVAPNLRAKIRELALQYRFFHWHIEFPAVFGADGKGGFDVVVGNPPWKMTEEDSRIENDSPEGLEGNSLESTSERLKRERAFYSGSGRFPLSAQNRLQLARLFADLFGTIRHRDGAAGMIVPSTVTVNAFDRPLWTNWLRNNELLSVWDFVNLKPLFPEVDSRQKFSVICLKKTLAGIFRVRCWLTDPVNLANEQDQIVDLTMGDLIKYSGTELALPHFRGRSDLVLLSHSIAMFGQLVASPEWAAEYVLLGATNDPDFVKQRRRANTVPEEAVSSSAATEWIPLYEGKMVGLYDHRLARVVWKAANTKRRAQEQLLTMSEKANPDMRATPLWEVPKSLVVDRDPLFAKRGWDVALCDVTSALNERTALAAVVPLCFATHNLPLVRACGGASQNSALFLAALASFALDYFARLRVATNHFTEGIFCSLPVPSPNRFLQLSARLFDDERRIARCVLELSYTAWDLEPFARDCGYDGSPFRWDEERRFLLRGELDAAFFHLYLPAEADGSWRIASRPDGCPYDEAPEQLAELKQHFPTPRDAVAYIMDTFPIVKRKDEEKYNGDYRTKRVILEIYDAMQKSIRTGQPYQTRLSPPPGPPTDEHGNFIPISQWDPNHWPSHIHPPLK